MTIIVFADSDWCTSNWVFRQLSDDIAKAFSEDRELLLVLQRAAAFGLLNLKDLERAVGRRVIQAIVAVAEKTIYGEVGGWKESHPSDGDGQRMYLESLSELLEKARRFANSTMESV